MVFSERLRNQIFWLSDMLKGAKVRRHFHDIDKVMSSADASDVEELCEDRLRNVLKHAIGTTEFYQGIDPKDGISAFPVIDKNLIRQQSEEFLSKSIQSTDRVAAITSGSTGTPFKTFQNFDKKNRNTADTIYFASLGGYNLGNKLFYFKIWSEYNKKSSLLQSLQNIVPVDVLNLKENVADVIGLLNSHKGSVSFLGYVSAFETLCKELDKQNSLSASLNVKSIITMSEGLDEYTKKQGKLHFNCPVLSRYSNIENGIIAQQTLANEEVFTINRASYFIEVMSLEKDELVPDGQLGRIIVTDYFNYAMPLIRYDTGDLGIKTTKEIDGVIRQVFTRIEGRKLDQIYNTKGNLISSYIVYRNMWNYTEIEQYQFVQKGPKEYVFKVSMSGKFDREAQLRAEFMEYLGADADFSVEYVREIPLLDSGKRKKVVNEMSLRK
jgi:phenylacetate-CoA ligase